MWCFRRSLTKISIEIDKEEERRVTDWWEWEWVGMFGKLKEIQNCRERGNGEMWGQRSHLRGAREESGSDGKASVYNVGELEDPLEKEMAIHSSTIAWKIPWTEEPGRLQSMGSQRVWHDWVTSLFPLEQRQPLSSIEGGKVTRFVSQKAHSGHVWSGGWAQRQRDGWRDDCAPSGDRKW